MHKILLLFFYLMIKGALFAQHTVQDFQGSPYTYIFQLKPDEAKSIYSEKKFIVPDSYFHSKVDSFPAYSAFDKQLNPGHYLFLRIHQNEIKYDLISENTFEVKSLNNGGDLNLVVIDHKSGEPRLDALIRIEDKIIPYDTVINCFHIPASNSKGLLEVKVKDEAGYFSLGREKNNPKIIRVLRKISYTVPFRYFVYPFRMWMYGIRDYGFYNLRSVFSVLTLPFRGWRHVDKSDKGYIAFNKPKYLPGDSVKVKAFVVNKNGKPVNKEMEMYIYKYAYGEKGHVKLATLKPVSPGAYILEFKLGDSLQLNRTYYIGLKQKGESKNAFFLSADFFLEDYQLREAYYKIIPGKKEFKKGDELSFNLSGFDANGLRLMDGRVDLNFKVRTIQDFYDKSVFIPDTVWKHSQFLEIDEETKVTVPDSVLPDASLNFSVRALFNNSNNESFDTSFFIHYSGKPAYIKSSVNGAFINAEFVKNGKSDTVPGIMAGIFEGDTLVKINTFFPFKEKINPLFSNYVFIHSSIREELGMRIEDSEVNNFCYRRKDSVFINITNPRNLLIHYQIYKEKKEIESGKTDASLLWKIKDDSDESYFLNYQYIWAGQPVSQNNGIFIFEKDLEVSIDQPATVYPGQKSNVEVRVKNYEGLPVPGVNITASAVNAQFKDKKIPRLPYFGKSKKYPAENNSFKINELDWKKEKKLDSSWIKRLHLDTLAYYKKIYPPGGLYYHYDSLGCSPQFAPFLLKNGRIEPTYFIFIDNILVYTYAAKNIYSFPADSGYHRIKIRAYDKTYIMDSVLFKKGFKLELCLDLDKLPATVKVSEKTPFLSSEEAILLNKTTFVINKNNLRYNDRIVVWIGKKTFRFTRDDFKDDMLMFGPFDRSVIHFAVEENFETSFLFEPKFSYSIAEGLIKLYEWNGFLKNESLPLTVRNQDFGHLFLEEEYVFKKSKKKNLSNIFSSNSYSTNPGNGTYRFKYSGDSSIYIVKLEQLNSEAHPRFYPGSTKTFYDLAPGYYRLSLITDHFNLMIIDSIFVTANGVLLNEVVDQPYIRSEPPDLFTAENDSADQESNDLNTSGKNYASGNNGLSGALKGIVKDRETGELLPFVNIVLEQNGSIVTGAATDFDGNYLVKPAPSGKYNVKASFTGYAPVIIMGVIILGERITFQNIEMTASGLDIKEFEVIEYSVPLIERSNLTSGSVVTRQDIDKLPGRTAAGAAQTVGGVYSKDDGHYFIDGIKVRGSSSLPKSSVISQKVLASPFEEFSFSDDIPQKQLRNKFSDYAYWQPNLITDKDGKASFDITFPDNITKWNSYALAMDGKKHSGTGYAETKSIKKLSANLAIPRFLIPGDVTDITGKVLNYSGTPVKISSAFFAEDQVKELDTVVKNIFIDHFRFRAFEKDSVKFKFTAEDESGYMDGEEKSIPLYPAGIEEAQGSFFILDKDTVLEIPLENGSAYTVSAEDNILKVLLSEIDKLKDYPYYCMEQTASKLKGLVMEKRIRESLGEKFEGEKEIKKLIRNLEKAQKEDGSWGWWPDANKDIWMSAYVTEAFGKVERNGYKSSALDKGIGNLLWNINYLKGNELLYVLNVLSGIKVKLNYNNYINTLNKDSLDDFGKLTVMKIGQENNIPYDFSWVLINRKETAYGNYYWGDASTDWYNNSNNITLLVYKISEMRDSSLPALQKIRNYFLEKKNSNGWRNTIESASILETILPGLSGAKEKKFSPVLIELSGELNQKITEFPFLQKWDGKGGVLRIKKTGSLPVYLSVYKKKWNREPSEKDSIFQINTWFEQDGKKADSLKAGIPATLIAEINVKKKSRYVMIEIPIPGGCSYTENTGQKNYREAHREYFRNKSAIFCNDLFEGKYKFKVSLEPRYSGIYTLNPAKAELMYFPVLFGRNSLGKIKIE